MKTANRGFGVRAIPVLCFCVAALVSSVWLSAQQPKPADAETHLRNATEFLSSQLSADHFNSYQQKILTELGPMLSVTLALGDARCADVLQQKLSTPNFLRDEMVRAFGARVEPKVLAR